MGSKEIEQLAAEIFKADPQIIHQGLIDLEGNVLLDQSSAASTPMEPDPDRIAFYNQLNLRRHSREHLMMHMGKQTIFILLEKKCSK